MKRPVPATDSGLSSKLVLIVITVAVASGGFILGYFVGKNVYAGHLVQQSLPKPAISEGPVPITEAKKIEGVLPTPEDQKSKKEGSSVPANLTFETARPKPSGSGQQSAAGKKFLARGDATSEGETVPDVAEEPTKVKDRQTEGGTARRAVVYTVQVGAFKNHREADVLKANLEEKGYRAQSPKTDLKGKPLFKVVVGEFNTKKEAELLALKLKKAEGLHAFVVQKN